MNIVLIQADRDTAICQRATQHSDYARMQTDAAVIERMINDAVEPRELKMLGFTAWEILRCKRELKQLLEARLAKLYHP